MPPSLLRAALAASLSTTACAPSPILVHGEAPPEPPPGFAVQRYLDVPADGLVSFDIAPDSTAVQVFARVIDPHSDDMIGMVVKQGPAPVVDVYQASAFDAEVHMRWPQHPDQADHATAGLWEVQLDGPAEGRADVTVLEWADEDPDSGTVHVQVVFTDGMDRPEVEAAVQTALDRWASSWAPYGLSVQPYLQKSNAPRRCPNARPSNVGSPVYEALSEAGADHDVTLVICDSLAGQGSAIGVSFGGPLVASPHAAGAVLFTDKGDRLGQTMAHEIGHYAGLGHADEDDGLDDTEACGPDTSRTDCHERLGQNSMYSSAICGTELEGAEHVDGCVLQDELTADQVWMLQSWIGTTE